MQIHFTHGRVETSYFFSARIQSNLSQFYCIDKTKSDFFFFNKTIYRSKILWLIFLFLFSAWENPIAKQFYEWEFALVMHKKAARKSYTKTLSAEHFIDIFHGNAFAYFVVNANKK